MKSQVVDMSCYVLYGPGFSAAELSVAELTRGNTRTAEWPMAFHALSATVLLQGISGLVGGYALLADPSGRLIGLPLAWLEGTPFSDYFVPGLILFSVLGVCPLVVAWGLWRGRSWAWYGSVLVGTGLAIWILVEIVMIGYQPAPPLQAFYGSLSVAVLSLSAAPSVRQRLLEREHGYRRV